MTAHIDDDRSPESPAPADGPVPSVAPASVSESAPVSAHAATGAPIPGPASAPAPAPVSAADASADGRTGAHAQPIEVSNVPPRPTVIDRRRYFLSSLEPSGEFDSVIVAVTDGGRRRYFTTRDGARMTEVDHDWFDRRSTDGGRSLLELDERELGELEAELQFVRPVRGRDPIAEAVAEDGPARTDRAGTTPDPETAEPDDSSHDEVAGGVASGADIESGPHPAGEPPAAANEEDQADMTDATNRPLPADPPADPPAHATADDDDLDPVTEEFEAMVQESRRSTFVQAPEAASVTDPAPADLAPAQTTPAPTSPAQTTPAQTAPAPTAPAYAAPAATAPMTQREALEQVALAKGIAFIAHRGQSDRSGAPYIDHPGRIAERFDPATEPLEAASAWLHDVLEDTAITPEELFEAGVRPEVIEVVRLLTRTPDVSADDYYARLRGHAVARRVKLADIDDNTARWRLRRLDYDTQLRLVEKYRLARRALGD